MSDKSAVIVTGAAGNLGQRLLSLLGDLKVYAVDVAPPPASLCYHFERLDLADPASQAQLLRLIRDSHANAIVHLAFIIDPVRMGVLDVERMWQINVAGTGRVLDAIAEANASGSHVRQFIYPSSVSAYGPETPGPVSEDFPLGAHTLTYAVHRWKLRSCCRAKAPAWAIAARTSCALTFTPAPACRTT